MHTANTILLDNALATMGAGLPSAIIAAMLYPQRRVIAVCGDGGFMMNSQDLEIAIRLRLRLMVLILVDHGYGMIKWKRAAEGFGLSFENADFVKYAECYGAHGTRIEATADLATSLERAFVAGGVHLVIVPVTTRKQTRSH